MPSLCMWLIINYIILSCSILYNIFQEIKIISFHAGLRAAVLISVRCFSENDSRVADRLIVESYYALIGQ